MTKGRSVMHARFLTAVVLCTVLAGCTASDARMNSLRADMANRQAAAQVAASRPGATPEDMERARGYASAQSCIDQLQAHAATTRATRMAATTGMAAASFAGPGGALAARTAAPATAMAMRSQGEYRVACY
jgi:hypothetical protein